MVKIKSETFSGFNDVPQTPLNEVKLEKKPQDDHLTYFT